MVTEIPVFLARSKSTSSETGMTFGVGMIDFKIKVVDKIIRFSSRDPLLSYTAAAEEDFRGFIYKGHGKEDITFDIKHGHPPHFKGKKELFNAGEKRQVFQYKDKTIFEYPNPRDKNLIENAAEINKDMTKGTIYIKKDTIKRKKVRYSEGKKAIIEVKAKILLAFLVDYFARKEMGLMLHCSSIKEQDRLYLFAGKKNAGKSTIAELWLKKTNARVFNDDRAVLTADKRRVRFYNMPWAGTLRSKCSLSHGNGLKADNIFFIHHNKSNHLRKLDVKEAAVKLFQNSFTALYDKRALNFILKICSKIADSVPCYELGFVKKENVIVFLKEKLEKNHEKIRKSV